MVAEIVLGEIALDEIALDETALGEIAFRRSVATPTSGPLEQMLWNTCKLCNTCRVVPVRTLQF